MDLNNLWNGIEEEIKVQRECRVEHLLILHSGLRRKNNELFQDYEGYSMVNPAEKFLSLVKKRKNYEQTGE